MFNPIVCPGNSFRGGGLGLVLRDFQPGSAHAGPLLQDPRRLPEPDPEGVDCRGPQLPGPLQSSSP